MADNPYRQPPPPAKASAPKAVPSGAPVHPHMGTAPAAHPTNAPNPRPPGTPIPKGGAKLPKGTPQEDVK